MNDSILFQPVRLGDLHLRNRIVMAPLTRARAVEDRTPNDLMREYYLQRASAGLILSEATSISPQGVGYADTPGIWSDGQLDGWRKITSAVHAAGGLIMLQLWHVGRVSDPVFLNGQLPVAPSAIAPDGHVSLLRPQRPFVVPRALDREELPGIIEAYRQGALNAQKAGFDGVEIHGANGYLLDQFLQDGSNQRQDEYGGNLENRARLMLEVTDAVISVWGAGKVGMHLAPRGDAHGMGDSDLAGTFSYVAEQLGRRGLAFLALRESVGPDSLGPGMKQLFGGALIANEKLTGPEAERLIREGKADAVAFGKDYIANPDLVERLRQGRELNIPDPSTFYGGGARGYIDYPVLVEA
jgi:2,4-dienoyl-CoA reductase-like NADH-dependent reductase (Old Yellow Enzyme family)